MKTFAVLLAAVLVTSVFAVTALAQRTPVGPPYTPAGPPANKGTAQDVCNTQTIPAGQPGAGQPNPAGCATAFIAIPQVALCDPEYYQGVYLVGCDMPSTQACTNQNGQSGVWCTCYYLCIDKVA